MQHIWEWTGVQPRFGQENLKETDYLQRPRCIWEDNIKVVKEIWWEDVDWIHLAQNRDQWQAVVKTNKHQNMNSLKRD
jgi:hypothetical protein